jgi:cytochrome c551/c552
MSQLIVLDFSDKRMEHRTQHRVLAILMSIAASSQAFAIEEPSEIFKKNCSACHQLANEKKPVVGPSLVEINHLYEKDEKKFIDWCVKPGKVRAGAIQMPSMAHLKKEELAAVHGWIKEATKGKAFVKEVKKKKPVDPYKLSEKEAGEPRIQRIFLPFSSPASVAITLDGEHSLCWDTLSCRLRYVWKGGFIDGYPYWRGNGGQVAKIVGGIYYQAPLGLAASMKLADSSAKPRYEGYKVINGLPEFQYSIGKVKVSEAISNDSGEMVITIKTSGVVGSLTYPLGDLSKCDFSYSKGKLVDGALVLNSKDASEFTIRFSAKQK